MKKCLSLMHLITTILLISHAASSQSELPQARIVNLTADPGQVLVLHLRPGYVSSVRVLEEVNSIVLGDPGSFKAEHSEDEPQLVFFKATNGKPAQTNALITTKSGREISLSLISQGKSDHNEVVDYVLNCERPHSFLITSPRSGFVIGETFHIPDGDLRTTRPPDSAHRQEQQNRNLDPLPNPHWQGKQLRVAVGLPNEQDHHMTLRFDVLNTSERTIEVLPPQIELSGKSKDKHRRSIKAEPVAIDDYRISARTLPPGARAEGVLMFERPNFKESDEQLLLAVAQAEAVDRPVLVPIEFVASVGGGAK